MSPMLDALVSRIAAKEIITTSKGKLIWVYVKSESVKRNPDKMCLKAQELRPILSWFFFFLNRYCTIKRKILLLDLKTSLCFAWENVDLSERWDTNSQIETYGYTKDVFVYSLTHLIPFTTSTIMMES